MDKIKVLEEIGLKKVSQETHIEEKYIKYMVNSEFDKLNHINTLGFAKILSKAYNIDLDDWIGAFQEYWIEAHREDEDQGLFIYVDDAKKSKKLLVFIILVIVIATSVLLFSLFKDKAYISEYINQDKTVFEQSEIVKDTQKTLDEINASEKQIVIDEPLVPDDIQDENQTQELFDSDKVEENITIMQENIPEVEQINEDLNETVSTKFEKEAILTPNSKLWIGVIYLDNKKRRSYMGDGNFSIDTQRDQIITTGHGSFNITQDGKIKKFNTQAPIRFLVKDNNITQIDWSTFKELNEGNSW